MAVEVRYFAYLVARFSRPPGLQRAGGLNSGGGTRAAQPEAGNALKAINGSDLFEGFGPEWTDAPGAPGGQWRRWEMLALRPEQSGERDLPGLRRATAITGEDDERA